VDVLAVVTTLKFQTFVVPAGEAPPVASTSVSPEAVNVTTMKRPWNVPDPVVVTEAVCVPVGIPDPKKKMVTVPNSDAAFCWKWTRVPIDTPP
jgi:hypothetical protein